MVSFRAEKHFAVTGDRTLGITNDNVFQELLTLLDSSGLSNKGFTIVNCDCRVVAWLENYGQMLKYNVAQFIPKSPKKSPQQFRQKSIILKVAQSVVQYFGNICTKICHQVLSKIAQSGHTDYKASSDNL